MGGDVALNLFDQAFLAAASSGVVPPAATTFGIDGYVDGLIANPNGNAPVGGEVVWDGTFLFWNGVETNYARDESGPFLLMSGNQLCNAYVESEGSDWRLTIRAAGEFPPTWTGVKVGGSPVGVYTNDGGSQSDPATLTLVDLGGSPTDVGFQIGCLPF